MNAYDKHQLTARELEAEAVPSTLELFAYGVILAAALFSAFLFFA